MAPVVGVVLIIAGVIIQMYERYVSKTHGALLSALRAHTRKLERQNISAEALPADDLQFRDSKMSFKEIRHILVEGGNLAIEKNKETLEQIVTKYEENERKKEPIYIASFVSIVIGTILTII